MKSKEMGVGFMSQLPTIRSGLLKREESLLVIIDIQERLLPVMAEKESVLKNAVILAKFASIIGLPVLVSEQQKLGPTVTEISEALADPKIVSKISFDCFEEDDFIEALEGMKVRNLILCGIETHICVAQTALSGLRGYNVHVVADAAGSRNTRNRDLALDRLSRAGAVLTSTEMAVYELLGKAGTDEFKATLKLVK